MTAQQLIVQIGVKDVAKFQTDMKRAGDAVRTLEGTARSLGSSITRAVTSPMAMLAGVTGGAGLIGMAKYALDTSMEMDTLQRRLAGVTGSFRAAADIIKYVQQLAVPSVFDSMQLGNAAVMLEAYGLSAKKWLPIAESITTAMFGPDTGRLQEFVSLLGRAKGGGLGEVFGPEGLGRFGLGRDVFKQMGLAFTKNNEFVGSVDEAMSAIYSVIQTRFGAIAAMMQSGPAAKMASAMDALKMAAKSAGDVMMTSLLPVMEHLTSLLDRLTRGGVIQLAITGFARLFGSLRPQGATGAIVTVIEFILDLPSRIARVLAFVNKHMTFLKVTLGAIALLMAVTWGSSIISSIANVAKAFMAVVRVVQMLVTSEMAAALLQSAITGNPAAIAGVIAATALIAGGAIAAANWARGMLADIGQLTRDNSNPFAERARHLILQGLVGGVLNPKMGGPDATGADQATAYGPGGQQAVGYLRDIRDNTKPLQEMQKAIMGGGDLGRYGVTPAEIASSRGQGTNIHIQTRLGRDELLREIKALQRAGLLA